MKTIVLIFCLVVSSVAFAQVPNVLHVDSSAAACAGSGVNWASAIKTLRRALEIAAANPNVTRIKVAGNHDIADPFESLCTTTSGPYQMVCDVRLEGGWDPTTDQRVGVSLITSQLTRVFEISGCGPSTQLIGLSITGRAQLEAGGVLIEGGNPSFSCVSFLGCVAYGLVPMYGGAVRIGQGGASFEYCNFVKNGFEPDPPIVAVPCFGAHIAATGDSAAPIRIKNCSFELVFMTPPAFLQSGGHVYVNSSNVNIEIEKSYFGSTGGFKADTGGALWHTGGGVDVVDSVFSDLQAMSSSAVAFISANESVTLRGCQMQDCDAPLGTTVLEVASTGQTLFENVAIRGCARIEPSPRRLLLLDGSTNLFRNCTVANNNGWVASNNSLDVANSILWDNQIVPVLVTPSSTVVYSCIQGGWPGAGNISIDPGLPMSLVGTPVIGSLSPARDAGLDALAPIGTDSALWDVVSIQLTSGPCPIDVQLNAKRSRIIGCHVDMGAFEVGCLADLNNDGVVDFNDYTEFLNLFNSSDLRADFNCDDVIDFNDYLEFLNQFQAGC